LFTGYLKQIGTELRDNILHLTLIIPNIEVKSIYQRTISQWFKDKLNSDSREKLLGALISKDSFTIENIICDWLNETISYYDEKEQYYHGFLTGLLSGFQGYTVKSNRESGDGRPDIILMERRRHETAIIIEVKSAKVFSEIDLLCESALIQIEKNRYETELLNEGYTNIIKCAVVFCKKTCKVKFA
ncbi:MAG: PD-(D/E)XK nuclease domain-containing protein, partial [Ruminococcus sp.]